MDLNYRRGLKFKLDWSWISSKFLKMNLWYFRTMIDMFKACFKQCDDVVLIFMIFIIKRIYDIFFFFISFFPLSFCFFLSFFPFLLLSFLLLLLLSFLFLLLLSFLPFLKSTHQSSWFILNFSSTDGFFLNMFNSCPTLQEFFSPIHGIIYGSWDIIFLESDII